LIASDSTLSEALLEQSRSRSHAGGPQREGELLVREFSQGTLYSWNANRNHARIVFGGTQTPSTASTASTASTKGSDGSTTADSASDEAAKPAPFSFSLTLLQGAAAVSIPAHTHASAWETLLVIQSKGALELRGRSYAIDGGEVIHIAPEVRHGYQSAGTQPLSAVQLYTPAGPERRFIEAARASNTPVSGAKHADEAKVAK
jgi:quercetin dioxygenase-like cupin family protein